MATALVEENLRPDGTIAHERLISAALGITYLGQYLKAIARFN